MSTSTDNPIETARGRLNGGLNWQKGAIGDPDTKMCIFGACEGLGHFLAMGDLLDRVATEQFPDRVNYPLGTHLSAAPAFNDHPDTTWDDVDLVLDKAARAWDEQHSGGAA